jgi:phosphoglycerate dehydrogenase-like enzyme/CMP-N-acetylneuraminic acid synthetase
MKKNNILCVILARGGSKGIPLKNITKINKHPLISYSIEAAKKSLMINNIVVSSDSNKIKKIARDYGAETPFTRSKQLSSDKAYSVDALRDALIRCESIYKTKFSHVIELPCVAPFRDSHDIDRALKILTKNKKNYDSVIGYVNTGEKHPVRLKRIKNFKASSFCQEYKESHRHSRRQDFEPCYIRNGSIYAMTRNCLINKKSREGNNSYSFIMPKEKSINIDDKFDLLIAKLMIEKGLSNNKPKKRKKLSIIKKKFILNKKKKLLITCPTFFINKNIIKNLKKKYDLVIDSKNIKINNNLLKNTNYWICNPCPTYKIDKKLLEKFSNLEILITPSTGSNHIDHEYCKNKIKIFSLKNNRYIKQIKASSEYTFAMLLTAARKIPTAIDYVKKGYWRNIEDKLRSFEFKGKTLGIIGFGRIGQNLYKYSKAFELNVIAYDPFIKNYKKSQNLKFASNLKTLCNKSDIICVCVNLNYETKNLINENIFKQMKKGVIFINSSRGEVVNEIDLLKYLKNKKISTAFLDVLSNENDQDFEKNKLIKYSIKNNNLYISPHIAGLTYQSEIKAFEYSIKILHEFTKK